MNGVVLTTRFNEKQDVVTNDSLNTAHVIDLQVELN